MLFCLPFNSDLGVNAMEKINANYPDNIIIFDDIAEQSEGDDLPEPRVFIPPSEEEYKTDPGTGTGI